MCSQCAADGQERWLRLDVKRTANVRRYSLSTRPTMGLRHRLVL